jgi:hypothetical protein
MHDGVVLGGVATDGDGHLADAEDVQHVELSRLESEAAVLRVELQRKRVWRLLHDAPDTAGARQHGIGGAAIICGAHQGCVP